jgi:hypothetical protein
MGDLKKFEEQRVPHLAFPPETQIIVREYPRHQAPAFPIDPGGHPLGQNNGPGPGQALFLPGRQGPAGAEDVEVFFNAGMQGSNH